jgi:hypothetical protein
VDVDSMVPIDNVEHIGTEEMGFQAKYTRFVTSGLPLVQDVPFASVDEAVRNFVIKFSAADAANGGALTVRIQEVSPEVKSILPSVNLWRRWLRAFLIIRVGGICIFMDPYVAKIEYTYSPDY